MGIKKKFKIFRAVGKALGGEALTDEDVCLIEEGLNQGIPLKDKQLQQLKDYIQKKKLERLRLPRDQNLSESELDILQRDRYLSTSHQCDGGRFDG